jgi:hypothetical protein
VATDLTNAEKIQIQNLNTYSVARARIKTSSFSFVARLEINTLSLTLQVGRIVF